MQNKEILAGTKDEQRTAADFSTSASVEASPMLSAALSVEECNFLIADFMGYRFNAYLGLKHKNITKPNENEWFYASYDSEEFDNYIRKYFEYHSSWDWQIPVWSKVTRQVKKTLPLLLNPEPEIRWYFRQTRLYENVVFNNQPEAGQKIIVELIKWYYNKNDVSVGSR